MSDKDNNKKKKGWSQIIRPIMNILSLIGLIVSVILIYKGYQMGIFSSDKALANFLNRIGSKAPLILIFLQIFRTVVKSIPAAVLLPVGVLLFGQIKGLIYNTIGGIIGSIILFFLARNFGKDLVKAVIGEKRYEKFTYYLSSQGKFKNIFIVVIFLPLGPYDMFCMLAGLSNMKFKEFFPILCLGKPVSIFFYTNILLSSFSLIEKLLI